MPKLRELRVDHQYQAKIHAAFNEKRITNLRAVNYWDIHLQPATPAELTAAQIYHRMWMYLETYKLSTQHISLWCKYRTSLFGSNNNVKISWISWDFRFNIVTALMLKLLPSFITTHKKHTHYYGP